MFSKFFAALAMILAIAFAPVGAAFADPGDYSPAGIEDGSGPRDVGAKIDDASGPRETVTKDNPYGAGVAPQTGNGPRDVGAKIESGNSPRPVKKAK